MISQKIGQACKWLLDLLVRLIASSGVHPNVLTALGLAINAWAAVLFANGLFFAAGLVVFLAGFFDLADGPVARAQGRVTEFGAFFDSIVDRYSDIILYMGLLVYYARGNRFFYVVLVAAVMGGSVMVSYARARAESLIGHCRVGFLERPERLVLIILGALVDRMAAVLWVMAILSNVTVIHRCVYTWREMRARLLQEKVASPTANVTG